MRRRWRVNWDTIKALASVWSIIGFVANTVVALVWRDHGPHGGGDTGPAWVHSPLHILFPVWIAPFALVAAAGALLGIAAGLVALWDNPPIHRVTENVEDMREHYHEES